MDWSYSDETVGSDFSLAVLFDDAPFSGGGIELKSGGDVVAAVRTDPHGVARFQGVLPGDYWAETADGLMSFSLEIKVTASHRLGEKLKLNWPSPSITVRGARGRFTTAESLEDAEIPMRDERVDLLDLKTARLVESVHTNANGEYGFAEADPGLYALRVTRFKKGDASESHDVVIKIDPAAANYALPEMTVVQSDCDGV